MMEHWHETYTSDVDISEVFATAFDPDGLVWRRSRPLGGQQALQVLAGCDQ